MRRRNLAAFVFIGALPAVAAFGGAPAALHSGPQAGDRPLPFTSTLVTGTYRGQQHCYICDLPERPAVLVFARRADEATARLLRHLRDAVRDHRKEKIFGWFVFLGPSGAPGETALEKRAYDFARDNGATALPVSALGDPQGPPGYRIAPEAEVTLIVFRRGKVLYNRAYRAAEWTPAAADGALKDLPNLLGG